MTIETAHLVEFGDITGIEFECLHEDCGTKFIMNRQKGNFGMAKCPTCGKDWIDSETQEARILYDFVSSVRKVDKALAGRKVRIRLQIRALQQSGVK